VVGQVVTATSSSGVVYTTLTDSTGYYTTTVPAHATYTVTTDIPAGTLPSTVITNILNDANGAANNDKNHLNTGTTATVANTDNLSVDFGFYMLPAQFGDRVWLESDRDGLASTGVITPVAGMVLTATDGVQVYTATTTVQGYYSFTVPAGTYTVTYGVVPASDGTVAPSSTPGGHQEDGPAGVYGESGNPDQSHLKATAVTVGAGEANWRVDFAFTLVRANLHLSKQVDKASAMRGETVVYTVVLTNTGPDPATGVVVKDQLPGGVTYQSASAHQGTYAVASGLWTVGTVAANTSVTLTLTVQVQ
jgi:uncharacterized repeat protein (TIGR01451 family)